MSPIDLLRVFALMFLSVAIVQDVSVVFWYAHFGLSTPRRVLHVVSVGLGFLLAYSHMAIETVRLLMADAPLGWSSPMLISSAAFTMVGVHFLWLDARRRQG